MAVSPNSPCPTVVAFATAVPLFPFDLLPQPAAAASPTPLPSPTPTVTPIPSPTEASTATPDSDAPKRATVNKLAACWFGPGPTYQLESNISNGKKVELLGIGSVEGWYVIVNPYFHQPCWIAAEDLDITTATDTSTLPVMTPGH